MDEIDKLKILKSSIYLAQQICSKLFTDKNKTYENEIIHKTYLNLLYMWFDIDKMQQEAEQAQKKAEEEQ